MKYRLALCTVHRNEESYLPEWIAYHLSVGVEHFFVYDNDSARPTSEALRAFIDRGVVTVTPFEAFPTLVPSYEDCLQRFGPLCRWIGFCDCDEFFVPKADRFGACHSLPQILEEYEEYGGLVVNGFEIGPSGILTRPQGLQLEAFRYGKVTDILKTFAQPARVRAVAQSHYMEYREPYYAVNENHDHVPAGRNPPWENDQQPAWFEEAARHSMHKVQLNHYFFRSREEYEQKMLRGAHDGGRVEAPNSLAWWLESDEHYTELDEAILRHASNTRELMAHLANGAPSDHPALEDLARREPHVGWRLTGADRASLGRFFAGPGVLVRSGRALAIVALHAEGARVVARHELWAGSFALTHHTGALCADVDGDGRDEIVLHGNGEMGVVALREGRLRSLAAALAPAGELQLVAADLDGDGAKEIVLRGGPGDEWLEVWRMRGDAPSRVVGVEGSIGSWSLSDSDRAFAGRFSRTDREELLLVAPHAIGLVGLRLGRLESRGVANGNVGAWTFGSDDRVCVGDFDGDGLDELFVCSAEGAALLGWRDGGFCALWVRNGPLDASDGGAPVDLAATERLVAGPVLPGRAALVYGGPEGLALIAFEGDAMRIRARRAAPVPWSEATGRLCPEGPVLLPWDGYEDEPGARRAIALFHGDGGLAVLGRRCAGEDPERLELRFLTPAPLLFADR
jgi:hypothetical protein